MKARSSDSRLFLGIIGEFSSGKSTLINALLRENLLKTDILPATTCALTILEYGEAVDAAIHVRQGDIVQTCHEKRSWWHRLMRHLFRYDAREEFERVRAFVHRYTAEEEHARHVVRVEVKHPNERLRSGFVIVDTPGINVENPRHAEVTRTAVRDVCDAFILLVPAPAACSKTLMDFMRDNLSGSLHRCIVLVTKIDLIPPCERDALMKFVSSRLYSELGGRFASILSAAPLYAFNHKAHGVDLTATDFHQQFEHVEQTALAILERSRVQIICEQILETLVSVLRQLTESVKIHQSEYQQRHAVLEKSRLPDLQQFLLLHKEQYARAIQDTTRHLPQNARASLESICRQLQSEIASDVHSAKRKNDLQHVMATTLRYRFKVKAAEVSQIAKNLCSNIAACTQQRHSHFQSAFHEHYPSLAPLGGMIQATELSRAESLQSASLVAAHANHAAAPIVAAVKSSQTRIVVSVCVGAGVGTLIPVPIVGTVIGGLVGWLVGTLRGPSLGALQQNAILRANEETRTWANDSCRKLNELMTQEALNCTRSLNAAIDLYGTNYGAKVQEMIRKDEAARVQLEEYIKWAERDLEALRHRESAARRALIEAGGGEEKE